MVLNSNITVIDTNTMVLNSNITETISNISEHLSMFRSYKQYKHSLYSSLCPIPPCFFFTIHPMAPSIFLTSFLHIQSNITDSRVGPQTNSHQQGCEPSRERSFGPWCIRPYGQL